MAITYTLAGSNFVDSQFGTAASATGLKTLVPQVVDRRFHKQVLKKSLFTTRGLMGPDGYAEGGVEGTITAPVILQKSELSKQAGDVIKMSLRRKLTADHLTGGKVLNLQLVDAESTYDFYSTKVSIERLRHAVYGFGGMANQRNPFGDSIKAIQSSLLQEWWAEQLDTQILYALWCGYSPNLIRAHGATNCDPTKNPNTLFGNDTSLSTSRTIADLLATNVDDVSAKTFEVSLTYFEQNDFDMVNIDGGKYIVALISPRAKLTLLQDDRFRNAQLYARERGLTNPLFKSADFVYNNNIIMTYDKVRSILGGHNPDDTITVSSNTITVETDYSPPGGITASQLHQTLFLGGNSAALADNGMTGILDRKEDDYGNIIGSGIDTIFGARRTDFAAETATTIVNQSSLVIVNTMLAS
jgi:hypothetical protein